MNRVSEVLHAFWLDRVLPRYQALQPREQRLVAVAAVLLPLIVLSFGVLMPVRDERVAAEARLADLQEQLVQAWGLAELLVRAADHPAPDNVLAAVEKLARDHGVREFMTRLKPQSDLSGRQKLLLQIRNAPFSRVLPFLKGVDERGLAVVRAKLQAAKEPARVDLQLVLAQ